MRAAGKRPAAPAAGLAVVPAVGRPGDAPLHWPDACRLVPSRFPPVSLFDQVADPADLAVVFAVEALGNPRLRDAVGELQLVPPEQRISGPGTSPIMAAFTHLNPEGSRFSDGSYGVYYAAEALDTAVAELSHHRAVFLARTREAALDVDLRCYRVTVQARLHDLRGLRGVGGVGGVQGDEVAPLYLPDSYAASQAFSGRLRSAGAAGIAYDSVRRADGQCVALFTPKACVPPARQAEHVTLRWNGERISDWYLKSAHHPVV